MNDNDDALTPDERTLIAGVLVVLAEKLTILRPGWAQFTVAKKDDGRLFCVVHDKSEIN